MLVGCTQQSTETFPKFHTPTITETDYISDSVATNYYLTGLNFLEEHKYDSAKFYFLKSIEIEPHPETYNELGIIEYIKKDFGEALNYFEKGISVDSTSWVNYIHKSRVYLGEKEYEKANRQLDLVIKNATHEYWRLYAYFYKSILVFNKEGNCELAIQYLDKCSKLESYQDGIDEQYDTTSTHIRKHCKRN